MLSTILRKLETLNSHSGFVKYLANTSWLIAEKSIRLVTSLFVGVWVARYLGPEQFGILSYAQNFVGLFAVIASLGLDAIIVRELVKSHTKTEALLCTGFVLHVIGAILVLAILALATSATSNDYSINVLIFIIASATVFQSFNVIDYYFQSQVLSKYVVFANIITLTTMSIIKISLILNDAPLIAFAIVILLDSFLLACCLIYFFFAKFRSSAL